MLRDQVHHRLVRAEGGKRQAAADRLGQADHVGVNAEIFAGPPQPSLAPVFTSSKISRAPFLVADLAQTFQEAGLRHAQARRS